MIEDERVCTWEAGMKKFEDDEEEYESDRLMKKGRERDGLAPSSPSRSPKRSVYYVKSPSRDFHDGDKSSSKQPSPMESPSHPSFGRHSMNSSASRFSGNFRSSSGRSGTISKRNNKGWHECNVIVEEGKYDDFEDKAYLDF
ncbi:hypothetical protein Ddye_023875 [Dipteronia dyeriana]|uniref:Uncharacterized protein n=1 Tax=Dipteronia dyeriana TaxID=168575 RepID=A0AAD9TTS8_9ROSI|nr:hypothetical protein Ddye_023875 [Dipteronia dyeriana]